MFRADLIIPIETRDPRLTKFASQTRSTGHTTSTKVAHNLFIASMLFLPQTITKILYNNERSYYFHSYVK